MPVLSLSATEVDSTAPKLRWWQAVVAVVAVVVIKQGISTVITAINAAAAAISLCLGALPMKAALCHS